MSEGPLVAGRLDSWKDIATYVGRNVRTVIRWEKQRGLPIHRVPGGGRQVVFAYPHEIDAWLRNDHPGENGSAATLNQDEATDEEQLEAAESVAVDQLVAASETEVAVRATARFLIRPMAVSIAAGILALLGISAFAVAYLRPRQVQFTGVIQITHDGTSKAGLITDGKTLYFSEHRNGKTVLAATSAQAGAVRVIPTPFSGTFAADISPDGRHLLLIETEGLVQDAGGPLWVLSVPEEKLQRIGQIACNSAAWSPDLRWIAFSFHNSIFVASKDGSETRQLHSFDGIPQSLRWSADGKFIRTVLRDRHSFELSLWDLVLDDQGTTKIASINPVNISVKNVSPVWALRTDGNSFMVGGEDGDARMFFVGRPRRFWQRNYSEVPLSPLVEGIGSIASDSMAKRIFVTGSSVARQSGPVSRQIEIIRFVPGSNAFRWFLPGLEAIEVSFSPDGNRIAYIGLQDQALWVSNSDGSGAQRLLGPVNYLELPRWSPDGKLIAFMARFPGRPWRIFIVSSSGGRIREASIGTDSQGAPTWSPDGKWLVYGNVNCQEDGTCAIHKIRIANGEESLLPGSEGLGTARWSPDGRFIAALRSDEQEVALFDIASGRWRRIANGVTGNDLAWSRDSSSVYAISQLGANPQILRISARTGETTTAVDLTDFVKLSGELDPWFTVASDGSILFGHHVVTNEIYALDYRER